MANETEKNTKIIKFTMQEKNGSCDIVIYYKGSGWYCFYCEGGIFFNLVETDPTMDRATLAEKHYRKPDRFIFIPSENINTDEFIATMFPQ